MAFWDFIRNRESGSAAGNYQMPGKTSNAYGAYQFTPATWDDVRSRSGLNLPDLQNADQGAQDSAADWYMGQIEGQLKHEPTDINRALAWNYGAGGANQLLSADPNAPASSIIGDSGNVNSAGGKNVGGMSVGQLLQGFNNEYSDFTNSQQMAQIPAQQSNTPIVKETLPALAQGSTPDSRRWGVDPNFWGGDTTGMGPGVLQQGQGQNMAEMRDAVTMATQPTNSFVESGSPALGPMLQSGQMETPEQVQAISKEIETEIDAAAPEEKQSLLQRYGAWLDADPSRRDKLLAIGTGLLSTTNWSDGFGAASQNLLDMRQNELKGAPGSGGFQSIGSVKLADGTQVGNVTFDKAGGRYFSGDRDITDQMAGATELNNSDAFGSKAQLTALQAQNTQENLTTMGSQLETFDRVSANLASVSYGAEGFKDDLVQMFNTLRSRGVSEEALLRGVTQGELQGMVGQSRTDVVGPGVMTEQDAARVIMALGGDLQSVFDNPEKAIELLGIMKGKTQKRYDVSYDQFSAHNQNFPNLGYITPDRYAPLDQSNGQSSGDVPEGMDPQDWEFMTPEERALFQ